MNDPIETTQCTNCKLEILSSNYTIHSLHCLKNIYLCDKCEKPVNYNKKIDHDQTNHVTVCCSKCNAELEKYLLGHHLENDCPNRKIRCQICDIDVTAAEIFEHENYCGSRTEKCLECGEFIMLKYKSLHIDSNHTFIKLIDEPGPSPSWLNGKRTLSHFMPDLPSGTITPSTVHKKKSERNARLRNLETNESSLDSCQESGLKQNLDYIYNEKDKVQLKRENCSKIKDVKTSSKQNIDEWPALTSLRSLQISEENRNSLAETSNALQNEESDLMYAIQVSQQLNSQILCKDFSIENEEASKNSFQSLTENDLSEDKVIQKNMFDKNIKKGNMQSDVNIDRNVLDYFYEEHESVKLPCEFCGSLIISNELILHQSRCSLTLTEPFSKIGARQRMPYFDENVEDGWEKKISCGICNKVFKSSLLENHELHCRRNLTKPWKNQDKGSNVRNVRSMNVKSEPGIQNGVEPNSPRLNRVGTRSEWLSELSKSTEGKDLKNNLNYPEKEGSNKAVKALRKNRRAPSPPRR